MKLKLIAVLLILVAAGAVVVIKVVNKDREEKPSAYFDNSKAKTKVGDEERF